jgi:Tol biopolymer transport system component
MRTDDFNLYIINPDGTGLKKVIDEIDYELLVGWSPDGIGLFYGVNTQGGILLNQLDIASGENRKLFAVDSKGLEVSLSPDGNRFAFRERSGDALSHGVYTSALDGSDRKLIAQMGQWLAVRPVWSPDGKWLMMGILSTDDSDAETVSAAVNLQTCQIVPLPLIGDVSAWVP